MQSILVNILLKTISCLIISDANDLIRHLQQVKNYLNDDLSNPSVCTVNALGEIQGRGSTFDAKCGQLAALVKAYKVVEESEEK